MDDYSKTAPSSYKTATRRKDDDNKKAASRALDESTEEGFLAAILDINPGVGLDHPGIQAALKLWRQRHP